MAADLGAADAEVDARRLVEAFAVVGVSRDGVAAQVAAMEAHSRALPLADRVFAPSTLGAHPPAAPGSARAQAAAALPLFCFPDGVRLARVSAGELHVPRFAAFVLTRDDFARLHGYVLTFWAAVTDALATAAGAGAEGAGGWSAPMAICILCRAECARPMERLLRALHALAAARDPGGGALPTAAGWAHEIAISLACSVAHVCANAPLPQPGAPPVVLHAAGVAIELGAWVPPSCLPPPQHDLACLTGALSTDALLATLGALLLERKVVMVGARHERVAKAVLAAQTLLYPLVWQNVLVPLLPSSMLETLHTPFPALLGLRLEQLMRAGSIIPHGGGGAEGCVWVHLDRGRVDGGAPSTLPLRERRWLRAELLRLLPADAPPSPSGAPRAPPPDDARVQRLVATAIASLLCGLDALLPAPAPAQSGGASGGGGTDAPRRGWRRTESEAAALEAALARRPRADRPFLRALHDTQHVRTLVDVLARARVERALPASLLPFERLREAARALDGSVELPAGDSWARLPTLAQACAAHPAPDALVVPPEAPAPAAAPGACDAPHHAPPAYAGGFPTDLGSQPARVLPLPALGAQGTRIPWPPAGSAAGAATRRGGGAVARAALLPLARARSDAAIDAHRYAEDEGYRARVSREQTRGAVAAGALALGGATAGALLCCVQ